MPPLRPILPSLLRPFTAAPLRTFTTTAPTRLAKISIVGRLAAEPEITPTSSGQDVVRYTLGTSHGPRDNKQTSWWKVAAFPGEGNPLKDVLMGLGKGSASQWEGKSSTRVQPHATSMLYVEGSCKMDKFTDKEGNDRSALNIVQRQVEILDRRDHNGERTSGGGNGGGSEGSDS
ncbi:MAG: hypothetical protein L6R37_004025 [Teloschistes peruensis]|nr:MAG: hypothetical protein L6R37_004025 [Teloschistes peruensis]